MQSMIEEADGSARAGKVIMDELIKEVLGAWGDFSVRFDGRPEQGPAALGMERAVAFSGATQGTLVLRCPLGLGSMLAKARGQGEADAAFRELSIQVGRRLLESLGGPEARPALLSDRGATCSRDWPAGRPRLSLALLVVTRDLMIIGAVVLSWLLDRPMEIKPLWISKANTFAQIGLVALLLASLAFGWGEGAWVTPGLWIVAALTLGSLAAYFKRWMTHMMA